MKNVNCKISDEAYNILSNHKTNNGLKKLEEALDSILIKFKNNSKSD